MFRKLLSSSYILLVTKAFPSKAEFEKRACPNIHVFGARETTTPPGYGTTSVVVNLVLSAYPGATSEAINYPACGGQTSCGDVSYASSVAQGVAAVTSAVNIFNSQCPQTQLVLVGYSQGSQIMDDALCGGGDTYEGLNSTAIPIQASAINMIAAAIFMTDPRFIAGLPYDVGTCQAHGFASRPVGFQCPSAAKIQSYCDAEDPYCCNGNNSNALEGYGNEYAQAALTFIKAKLTSGGGGNSTTTDTTGTATASSGGNGGAVVQWGQCGGIGWTGPTVCATPYTCQATNAYYSQCR